jgi:hypothetical protein
MELKRKYREIGSDEGHFVEIRLNNWFVRHFSLTGLYYHLSRYGHDLLRPTLFGIGIILVSTLLWLTQTNPTGAFSIPDVIGFSEVNSTNLEKAFIRSITNFIPLLPAGPGISFGLMDFVFKIVGGAVTFGFIIIALRRRFERKFRH